MSDWNFTQPEAWTEKALCARANPNEGHPGDEDPLLAEVGRDDFYPREEAAGSGFSGRKAKMMCAACPVQLDCLAYAMRVEAVTNRRARFGIWGGLTPQERHDLAEGKTTVAA